MSSYTQILKSSSLIGGAQGINRVLGMVRIIGSSGRFVGRRGCGGF